MEECAPFLYHDTSRVAEIFFKRKEEVLSMLSFFRQVTLCQLPPTMFSDEKK